MNNPFVQWWLMLWRLWLAALGGWLSAWRPAWGWLKALLRWHGAASPAEVPRDSAPEPAPKPGRDPGPEPARKRRPESRDAATDPTPVAPPIARPVGVASPGPTPPAAQWLSGRFGNAAGQRHYKLHLPGGTPSGPRALLVMLHGCKQEPDDFAAGTRMNVLAGELGWAVLYPAQDRKANRHGCWNWFRPVDQQRHGGEAEILAGMIEKVIAEHGFDRSRVFVAGLSAGGAMASVLAHTHPELFAGVGVHSGVAFAAAHDGMSALHTMKRGHRQLGVWPFLGRATPPRSEHAVPLIVFHGDEDEVVHPRNGEQVIEQALGESPSAGAARVEQGEQPGGHAFTRRRHAAGPGGMVLEHWVVHGAGHAWSGGDAAGSFTDPQGPSATEAMLRFFASLPDRHGPAPDV